MRDDGSQLALEFAAVDVTTGDRQGSEAASSASPAAPNMPTEPAPPSHAEIPNRLLGQATARQLTVREAARIVDEAMRDGSWKQEPLGQEVRRFLLYQRNS